MQSREGLRGFPGKHEAATANSASPREGPPNPKPTASDAPGVASSLPMDAMQDTLLAGSLR